MSLDIASFTLSSHIYLNTFDLLDKKLVKNEEHRDLSGLQ
jgi:hypothetical protein